MSEDQIRMDELLAGEFGQDPLYKLIGRMGATEELFDQHMMNLNVGYEYSTTDIEDWYCNDELRPATMRSWIKALEEYIEYRTAGKRGLIRMDYRAVFRVRMILLLRQKNVKLLRICQYAGVHPLDVEMVHAPANKSVATTETSTREMEVMKAIISQMVGSGLIEIHEGIPIVRIKEAIQEQLQEAQKLLPDPSSIEDKLNNKINEIQEKINEERLLARHERLNSVLTMNKINRQLEEEALKLWNQKPLEERTKKIGLFKRIEDTDAKNQYIKNYIQTHFEERLKREFNE